MTTRRRKAKQTSDDDEDTRAARFPGADAVPLVPPAPTLTEERRERELEDILQEIGSDGRVRVWHVTEGKPAYAGEMSMEGFSLDVLLEVFGGGDKTLAFYQGRERVSSARVSLDPGVAPRNPRAKSAAVAAAVAAPGGSFDATQAMMMGMGAIMKASADNSGMMMTAMAEMVKARPAERDPLEMVKVLSELMKANAPPPPPPPAPAFGITEAFALFEKGMSVAGKLGGGDDDPTASIIKEGIGAVGKIAEAIVTARGQAPPVAVVETPATDPHQLELAPTEAHAAPPPPPSSAALPPMAKPFQPSRPWHRAVLPHYDQLAMASRFMSGDSAAIELLRRVDDDDVVGDLMDDLEDATPPGFVERARLAFPSLVLSPEWVAQFHETLKANMEEEGVEEEAGRTTVAPPGVAGHIAPG